MQASPMMAVKCVVFERIGYSLKIAPQLARWVAPAGASEFKQAAIICRRKYWWQPVPKFISNGRVYQLH